MYIMAQYNAAMPAPEQFGSEFKNEIQKCFPDAEVEVEADGFPTIIIFDVEDEDEKEKIKFQILDIRKAVKMSRKEWKAW